MSKIAAFTAAAAIAAAPSASAAERGPEMPVAYLGGESTAHIASEGSTFTDEQAIDMALADANRPSIEGTETVRYGKKFVVPGVQRTFGEFNGKGTEKKPGSYVFTNVNAPSVEGLNDTGTRTIKIYTERRTHKKDKKGNSIWVRDSGIEKLEGNQGIDEANFTLKALSKLKASRRLVARAAEVVSFRTKSGKEAHKKRTFTLGSYTTKQVTVNK